MNKFAKFAVGFFAIYGASEFIQAFIFGARNSDELEHMNQREKLNAFHASRIK